MGGNSRITGSTNSSTSRRCPLPSALAAAAAIPSNTGDKRVNAAQLLVRCLENEGVEFVFGIPGEENIHIMDALAQSRIRFVTTRHEQGAAFMADVYGRLTGSGDIGRTASKGGADRAPDRRGEGAFGPGG